MKGLPKGARLAPLAPALNPGDLVLYENDGSPILALILSLKRDRFVVLNDRNREVEMPAARLYRLPFSTPMPASQRERVETLTHLMTTARTASTTVALADVWSLVYEQSREYTITELAELSCDRDSLPNHLATFLALVADRTYFKRHKETFSPRPKETVEQLLHAAKVAAERRARQQRVLQELRARMADHTAPISADVEAAVTLLREVAAECDGLQEREAEIREWLEVCGTGLGTTQHGSFADQAGDILDRTGFLTPWTNLAPARHRLRFDYSEDVLRAASELAEKRFPSDPSRRDLTSLHTFTIDDASTQDMDDALSLEHTGDGYRLGIHIVDISARVADGGILDRAAQQRATSLYLPERTVHMFPDSLAAGALSLLPGEDRPTISCFVELDRHFRLIRQEIFRSTIRSARRYTYDEVTTLLDGSDRELSPLYEIAMHYESERLQQGAIKASKRDLIVSADAAGVVSFVEIDEADPARNLVGELMVWVNQLFAEYAAAKGAALIYRGQAPCDVDPHTAAQRVPQGPAQDYVVRSLFKRSETSTRPISHASLGLKAYAQVSSPIRRYADLVNQRQIVSLLTTGSPYYSEEAIAERISKLEDPLSRANSTSKESRRFWLLQYLAREKRNEIIDATVLKDDPRGTLVELAGLYMPVSFRCPKRLKPGDAVRLRIVDIKPRSDLIRLELVS